MDPAYALAYSGLADCYSILAVLSILPARESFARAKAAAVAAVAFDEESGEAHTSLAWVLWTFDYEWSAAENEFERALALNPRNRITLYWHGLMLIVMGLGGANGLPVDTPRFRSETHEAEWWDQHPEVIDDLFRRGAKAGTITRGTVARALQTKATTIRLFTQDLERAKAESERKGLRYQTYLKMLIHEALPREAPRSEPGQHKVS